MLEGSVRKAGDRVRITAQLIDGATGGHLWAERYDRDLADIFALQDEISQAIVAALKLKLLPEEKKAIEQRGTTESRGLQALPHGAAIQRHRQLRRRPPQRSDHPSVSAAPPRSTRTMRGLGADGRRPGQICACSSGPQGDDGLAAAERALALDPNLAEAHAVRRESWRGTRATTTRCAKSRCPATRSRVL